MVEIARRIGALAGTSNRVEEHTKTGVEDECTWMEKSSEGWVIRTQTGEISANRDDLKGLESLEKLAQLIQELEKTNSK